MTDTPRPRKHPGTSPLWANLPRRKCDDCGKSYKPVRPVKENERGFCTPNCRKSYHKHGGAYRKLKVEMTKLVNKRMDEIEKQVRSLVLEELTKYAQYAKVTQDWAPSLRLPAPGKSFDYPTR
jgi:hypothetical protein